MTRALVGKELQKEVQTRQSRIDTTRLPALLALWSPDLRAQAEALGCAPRGEARNLCGRGWELQVCCCNAAARADHLLCKLGEVCFALLVWFWP